MIRGALQREIQCHFEIEPAGRSDEGLEVLERAELRVNSVVPAVDRADGPRRADVTGFGSESVVASLAVDLADGMDRRKVDDVETHCGDAG